jgi:glycosyltransferase involved in cell wall biosynthesis
VNRPLRALLAAADHVLYQSEFCKRSADEWVGSPAGTWEILPNAVDVSRFTPAADAPAGGPVLLLGGDQTQAYRLELAVATLAALTASHPDARLLVTGRLVVPWSRSRTASRSRAACTRSGAIRRPTRPPSSAGPMSSCTRSERPVPSVVLEALASGVPVVYPRSGGVPELVGDDAGIGVSHPDGFERDEPPDQDTLAAAITRVLADLPAYRAAARARAVDRFSLEPWLDRHAELFERLAPT